MKKLFLINLMVVGLWANTALADTLTVGHNQDYSTIQSAIDAAQDGDIVEVYVGTYYEDLIIPRGKTITVNGVDPEDNTTITIWGTITVNKRANLELQYVSLVNEDGDNVVQIKPLGIATLRYLSIAKGKNGVVVESDGVVELYSVDLDLAEKNGAVVKSDASFTAEDLRVRSNGLAGLRVNAADFFSVTESTIKNNTVGIRLRHTTADTYVDKVTFKNNDIAIRIISGLAALTDNTYRSNDANVVRE